MATSPRRRVGDADADRGRRRGRLTTLAVVAVAVVVIGGVWWIGAPGEPPRDGAPNWSPDSRSIVFAAEVGPEAADIWVMNADGSGRQRLTENPANDTSPSFSPDGRRIAFASDRDGDFEIYVMDRDGGNVRRLTRDPAEDNAPAWSPDGTRIVFTSDRNQRASPDIYSMNAEDGSDVQRHTDNLTNWAPQFSPDGKSIALQVNQDVVVIDVETGEMRRLTQAPQNGMGPSWSPDGRRLAFVTTRNRRAEIFTMNADGSDPQVLVSMPRGGAIDPRWSPDGSHVAFVFLPITPEGEPPRDDEHQAIYTIEIGSGRLTRLSP